MGQPSPVPLVSAPLRVAAVIDGLGWGGAEMLLADFALGAAAHDIELTVAYLKDKDGSPAASRLRSVGVDPVHLGIERLRQPSAVLILRRHFAEVRPDVVHTHLGYSDLLAGAAARTMRLPVVCTLHVMRWDGTGRELVKETIFGAVRRRWMSRVITVSDAARAAYLATGRDQAEHVTTVHNGVAGLVHPSAGSAIRAELGLDARDVVAVMVAVLRPSKGHQVALKAVAQLRRVHPELRLVIVGDGPSWDEISELAWPLGDGAMLTGHRDDVLSVLDAADLLVHPAEFDAFPTALLEAMAARVPIVATAVGGIPEIVDDGTTGVLIGAPPTAEELAAALRPLVARAELRRSLGEAGRVRFEAEFTAQRWGGRMRSLYEQTLHG